MHLGLGDAIILSGAAVYLAQQEPLTFPCKRAYLSHVQSFFVNHPKITVYPVDSEAEMEQHSPSKSSIRSGYYGGMPQDESLDHWFYRQMGIPFSVRWEYCPIKWAAASVPQEPPPYGPYAFVHDDLARPITKMDRSVTWVTPKPSLQTILQYAAVIENATWIHSINSSFQQLVNCLDTKAQLFLHWYARPCPKTLNLTQSLYQWNIIE